MWGLCTAPWAPQQKTIFEAFPFLYHCLFFLKIHSLALCYLTVIHSKPVRGWQLNTGVILRQFAFHCCTKLKDKILKCFYDQKLTMASFKSIIIIFMSTGSAINAFVAYGGWVLRNMGDWNCSSQTQTARTPKSPPYLQPSHEPCLPEQPCPIPRNTELEDQWKNLLSK